MKAAAKGAKSGVKEFYDAHAKISQGKEYRAFSGVSGYYYGRLREFIRGRVSGGSVLEIGCGDGGLLAACRPRFGVGIDISSEYIKVADAKHGGKGMHFVIADAEKMGLRPGFDCVLFADVLPCLPDLEACVKEAARVCRSGGRVVMADINPAWRPLHTLLQKADVKKPEPVHMWRGRKEKERMLREHGFRVAESGRYPCLPHAEGLCGFLPWLSLMEYVVAVRD